tara:strand:- start:14515 stop:16314 length:1800 start_codon:yes stop_codon:yes gene_type:complete
MKFTYFKFKNFKGIEDQKLDLSRSAGSNIFTLVGLNESGKTTILEAINFFSYKQETLDVLELDSYNIEDIHSLIPINRRDNFNDCIIIEAGLELSDNDLWEVKRIIKNQTNINVIYCDNKVSYTQKYHFKNSKHQPEMDESLWKFQVTGKSPRAKKIRNLTNEEKQFANTLYIKKNIPSILYFPNFLFEFPEKIYLDTKTENPKDLFYQNIIQDILDSLDNDLNIEEHLIERIVSVEKNEKRNLNSLIGKMNRKLSIIIFESWNKIFSKKLNQKEIVLYPDSDKDGAYLEFNIKDDVDIYRINERSLGFRWFFVYILLTQFRNYGKSRSNAFFLFDEPASNLHPAAQSELLKSFENLPNVLYTTHSHYLINPKWLESTYVVKNKGINYENEEDYLAKNTDISIMKYREFASKFPSQTSYFQPILEILEYKPSNLELVPKVIITEGKNDFYTFSYYQKIIKEYKLPLVFIPGTSSNNLENLISLYLGWGTSFIVLLDSDDAGKNSKLRYIELFGNYIEDLVITYDEIDKSWDKFETEKLFSSNDQLTLQKLNYPADKKFNKKNFNRSIQEVYVTNTKVKLDSETLENFNKVIKFLKIKLK